MKRTLAVIAVVAAASTGIPDAGAFPICGSKNHPRMEMSEPQAIRGLAAAVVRPFTIAGTAGEYAGCPDSAQVTSVGIRFTAPAMRPFALAATCTGCPGWDVSFTRTIAAGDVNPGYYTVDVVVTDALGKASITRVYLVVA